LDYGEECSRTLEGSAKSTLSRWLQGYDISEAFRRNKDENRVGL
jgi:hypothetical protein